MAHARLTADPAWGVVGVITTPRGPRPRSRMANLGNDPLAAADEAQAGVEHFGIVAESARRKVGPRVITLREVLHDTAQPRLFDWREGVPFSNDAIQYVADDLGQIDIQLRVLSMRSLHILQVRIGGLQQSLGGQQLPAFDMLFQPSQLAQAQSNRSMYLFFAHGVSPGQHRSLNPQWGRCRARRIERISVSYSSTCLAP